MRTIDNEHSLMIMNDLSTHLIYIAKHRSTARNGNAASRLEGGNALQINVLLLICKFFQCKIYRELWKFVIDARVGGANNGRIRYERNPYKRI